ncbi:hypothetical protein BH11CYA1_BH11CYA1_49550 [soil metagenome]
MLVKPIAFFRPAGWGCASLVTAAAAALSWPFFAPSFKICQADSVVENLFETVSAVAEAAEDVKAGLASQQNRHRSELKVSRNLWKYSVPVNAVSANGLPIAKLVVLLQGRRVFEIRALLEQTPARTTDADERRLWTAACFSSEGRYDKSILLFDQAKKMSDAPVVILVAAAKAYAVEGQYDKAIKVCDLVIAKYEMKEAYRIRAGCYGSTNRLIEAAADFEKLAAIDFSSSDAYLCKAGSLLIKAGKNNQALALVERGLRTKSVKSQAPLYLVKAESCKSLGHWQDAVVAITEAIRLTRLHPANSLGDDEFILSTCYKERSYCYKKLGKDKLAQADLQSLCDISKATADEIIGH